MRCNLSRVFFAVSVAFVAGGLSLAAQGVTNKDLLDGFANPSQWVTFSGDYTGQRHTPLRQITPANAGQLAAQWTFQTGVSGHKFETTPLVIDGTLYVTGPLNNAWAVDARTGKQLWRY
jgi:alcohol dehydrogenase (cytochrome c)